MSNQASSAVVAPKLRQYMPLTYPAGLPMIMASKQLQLDVMMNSY